MTAQFSAGEYILVLDKITTWLNIYELKKHFILYYLASFSEKSTPRCLLNALHALWRHLFSVNQNGSDNNDNLSRLRTRWSRTVQPLRFKEYNLYWRFQKRDETVTWQCIILLSRKPLILHSVYLNFYVNRFLYWIDFGSSKFVLKVSNYPTGDDKVRMSLDSRPISIFIISHLNVTF